MMVEYIRQALAEHYGLPINAVQRVSGGWTADAYVAKAHKDAYFVKLYDKRRPSVQPWIARMDLYMPITFWLYEHTLLRERMIVPLRTACGEYGVETAHCVLLVFPMLKGQAVGNTRLDTEQVRQLAAALAQLHSYGAEIPVPVQAVKEDYSLPFLPDLMLLMDTKETSAKLRNVLHPYHRSIKKGTEMLLALSQSMRNSNLHNVLCHTDLHGGNLMWNGQLVLIDWEGLRLAPAEADLFTFTGDFFFDYAGKDFLSAYQSMRPGYVVRQDAMRFYRLRRRLEDIAELARSMEQDALSPDGTTAVLEHICKECAALSQML